jgi:hypothetical protein
MSRTYRRKSLPVPKYVTREHVWSWYFGGAHHHYRYFEVGSHEYKKALAKHFSDTGTYSHKEPGPSWFRNLYTERPQRREAKRQIHKYFLDEEFEVILNEKDKLEYWT